MAWRAWRRKYGVSECMKEKRLKNNEERKRQRRRKWRNQWQYGENNENKAALSMAAIHLASASGGENL
jgi:hypothetical protein